MTLALPVILVAAIAVFVIAFMKGGFGGGFAILGIPLLSLVMDPLSAGAFLAPLFIAMDAVALYFWRPSTWSKPDLLLLMPAMVVGIGLGYIALRILDPHATAIVMALLTLGFAARWFLGSRTPVSGKRSTLRALAGGTGSGITTMVAHSGGPPLAMYLLQIGLPKAVYAGTTSILFTVSNLVKAGPWLLLAPPSAAVWTLMLVCLPIIPLGVWAGWKLHQRLDEQQLYFACYVLLVIVALKLLYDGIAGYIA